MSGEESQDSSFWLWSKWWIRWFYLMMKSCLLFLNSLASTNTSTLRQNREKNIRGKLFRGNLIGLWLSDWIIGCSKGKEGLWKWIRSTNLVLIWIKSSVCVAQNFPVDPKKQNYPDSSIFGNVYPVQYTLEILRTRNRSISFFFFHSKCLSSTSYCAWSFNFVVW